MSSSQIEIPTAAVFLPLLEPARYKGAFGGRGSGKSHFFAALMVDRAMDGGFRAVCIREKQKSLSGSAYQLLKDKIGSLGLAREFEVRHDRIICPGGGVILFQGMQDHTAESIKSLEGMDVAWVEEAQTLSSISLELLRPTVRKPGSELWFSWNPRLERDPVDQFFRAGALPPEAVVVRANYSDNPWFPAELEQERKHDLETNPDRYAHIWEGAYQPSAIGAYYASEFARLDADNRIGPVPYEARADVTTAWDLGIGDDTAIWFAQRIGGEVRVIDYYANRGEGLDHYAKVIKAKPYAYAEHLLPHDAEASELGTGKRRVDVLRSLDIGRIRTLPRQSVEDGIQAVRLLLPKCWFDAVRCKDGLAALREYRPDYDDKRQVFHDRPLHDWTSHAADAFRYLAIGWRSNSRVRIQVVGGPQNVI